MTSLAALSGKFPGRTGHHRPGAISRWLGASTNAGQRPSVRREISGEASRVSDPVHATDNCCGPEGGLAESVWLEELDVFVGHD